MLFSNQKHHTQNISGRENAVKFSSDLFYLEDVSLRLGSQSILNNINISIPKGEFLFITGPSGAGKTSFLKVLSGEHFPTGGRIISPFFDKKESLFISHVYQDVRLNYKGSCMDHIKEAYDPQLYTSKNQFLDQVHQLARAFGIEQRLGVLIRNANGGLKQIVAIMRGLLAKPDCILVDEPTSALDSQMASRLYDILSYFNKKRSMTIVWASHNKELVKKFPGKIVHLDQGKLIYSGHACFI